MCVPYYFGFSPLLITEAADHPAIAPTYMTFFGVLLLGGIVEAVLAEAVPAFTGKLALQVVLGLATLVGSMFAAGHVLVRYTQEEPDSERNLDNDKLPV